MEMQQILSLLLQTTQIKPLQGSYRASGFDSNEKVFNNWRTCLFVSYNIELLLLKYSSKDRYLWGNRLWENFYERLYRKTPMALLN